MIIHPATEMRIKYYLFVILATLAVVDALGQIAEETANSTSLLMIFAPDIKEENYGNQLLILSKEPIELDRRNILILEIFPEGGLEPDGSSMDEEKARKLRIDYKIGDHEFRIILLDKSGSVILNSPKTVENQEIFKLLDKSSP
ncbi:MAG TPA: DUF4174 domain-containing protein [Cyclobacteriaceae bacterium]|nr:DUF4174 domain-containing protein [Cyclobacteriaceae bacterium]